MKRSSADIRRGAIILGGHVQALGIVRILGSIGIQTVVIDSTGAAIARRSRYCNAFFMVRDGDLEGFLLSDSFRSRHENWVIFPTNDFHVRLLSVTRAKLELFYRVSTDNWEVTEIFYNKKKTYKLAEQTGVPIPNTFFPAGIDDLNQPEIRYPCIVKPAVMIDFYRKVKKKVFLCRDLQELRDNYMRALRVIPADEIIIQEVVAGDGSNQFSSCFLFLDGKSYVNLTACRLRQHPIGFGNATTYAEVADIPALTVYGEMLLKAAHYNGICEVEFKLDTRDGKYKLLEVNPRTWKWHSIAEKAGTPFLPLFFDHLTGINISQHEGYRPASFCHMITDLPVRLALFLRGDRNWKKLRRPVQHAVWSGNDPAPWFYEKLYLPAFLIKR